MYRDEFEKKLAEIPEKHVLVHVYKEGATPEQGATIWVIQDIRYDEARNRILIEIRD